MRRPNKFIGRLLAVGSKSGPPGKTEREQAAAGGGRSGPHWAGRFHRPARRPEDDYLVTSEVLGEGVQGTVLVGVSARSGESLEKVAIKRMKPESTRTSSESVLEQALRSRLRKRFEIEGRMLAQLDHPHIVRLMGVYDDGAQIDIVMECLEGGELFDRVLAKGSLGEAEAAGSLRQMLLALNYMHQQGYAHRDIKLENFLYESATSEHLKLVDFGYCAETAPNQSMTEVLGTSAYMAPEVLAGSHSSECDLWSLGVAAFTMIGGVMPFKGTTSEGKSRIKRGAYRFDERQWSGTSAESRAFVEMLLRVSPSERMSAAEALAHPWLLQQLPSATRLSSVSSGLVKTLRGYRGCTLFKRTCLTVVAGALNAQEQSSARTAFLEINTSGSGVLSLGEWHAAVASKMRLSDDEAATLYLTLDPDGRGVGYTQFLAALCCSELPLREGHVQEAFRRFDRDGDGLVGSRDLLGSLRAPNLKLPECEAMLLEASSGTIASATISDVRSHLLPENLWQSWARSLSVRCCSRRRDASA